MQAISPRQTSSTAAVATHPTTEHERGHERAVTERLERFERQMDEVRGMMQAMLAQQQQQQQQDDQRREQREQRERFLMQQRGPVVPHWSTTVGVMPEGEVTNGI